MKVIIATIIEKLHRYIFDNYYKQDYKITLGNKIVIFICKKLKVKNYNWRYILIEQGKTLVRYDNYNRD